jgi:hypothetical protein
MICMALILIVAAMILIRLGWGGQRHLAAIGWSIAAAALIWLVALGGAWGLAVGAVTGMTSAIAMLLVAGWTSPARARRPARVHPTIVLPRRPSDLARRIAVFALVVPAGFVAAQWLAFGVQAMVRHGHVADADGIVLTLFLQPILWSGIMVWQMTMAKTRHMIVPVAAAGVLGTMVWGLA